MIPATANNPNLDLLYPDVRNSKEAQLLLMVCATSAMYCDEQTNVELVKFAEFSPSEQDARGERASRPPPGWGWFLRVRDYRKEPVTLMAAAELIDLQIIAVSTSCSRFSIGGTTHRSWAVVMSS